MQKALKPFFFNVLMNKNNKQSRWQHLTLQSQKAFFYAKTNGEKEIKSV